jgi:type 1 fimbria pilin
MFLNVDMNGNSVKTTVGNLIIDASSSAGTGSIIETLKAGGNLIINNLPTSSAGLPTNAVWRNGNVLNIV